VTALRADLPRQFPGCGLAAELESEINLNRRIVGPESFRAASANAKRLLLSSPTVPSNSATSFCESQTFMSSRSACSRRFIAYDQP